MECQQTDVFASLDENIPDRNPSAFASPDFLLNRNFIKRNEEAREQLQQENFQNVKRLFDITKQTALVLGLIQEIHFANPFAPGDFRLFEVDKKLAEEIMLPGGELVIRGRSTDHVVACTKSKTYSVKEVEASNSFLIFPSFLDQDPSVDSMIPRLANTEMCAITRTYLEVSETLAASPVRFREVMERHILDVDEDNVVLVRNEERITYDSLLSQIQLCEADLQRVMDKYPIIECEDCLYLLSDYCQQRILDSVIELCDDFYASGITAEKITFETLSDKLNFSEPYKLPFTKWFIKRFCDVNEDGIHFVLNEKKVCRARAKEILDGDKKKEFPINTFLKLMERLLPNGFNPYLDCLGGIAYFDENLVTGKTIRSLNVDDLSMDVRERLRQLFAIRPLWKKEVIEPYVIDFCVPTKIEEFLLKHCRLLRKDSEKYFAVKQI